MKDSRRAFFKKSASLAATIPFAGISGPLILKSKNNRLTNYAKDAGMESSEAYFSGMNEQKINLLKQMDVFGA